MHRRDFFLLVIFLILVLAVAHVCACERASQEKFTVVGGGKRPFTHRLLPAGQNRHSHLIALDSPGNGTSTVNVGHSHQVQGYKVKPVGSDDRHVHDITKYMVSKS